MPIETAIRSRFFVLHNRQSGPRAGHRHWRLLDEVCGNLRALGGVVEVVAVDTLDEARAKARTVSSAGRHDALVVAGGDGTVRAAASELAGGALPLGVIPLGTANVLAEEVSLPHAPSELARTLRQGPLADIACGSCDGELFLLMAGAGFDGAVVSRSSPGLKRWLGKLAYAGPLLAELVRRPRAFEVRIDGVPHICTWLIASNARHYAGAFEIAARRVTDPGFQALVMDARSLTSRLRILLAFASNRVASCQDVRSLPCRRIEADDAPLQIDGDALPTRRLSISETKLRLRLIVPEGSKLAAPVSA